MCARNRMVQYADTTHHLHTTTTTTDKIVHSKFAKRVSKDKEVTIGCEEREKEGAYLSDFLDFLLEVAGITDDTVTPGNVSLRLHASHFAILVDYSLHCLVQHVCASIYGTKPAHKHTLLLIRLTGSVGMQWKLKMEHEKWQHCRLQNGS